MKFTVWDTHRKAVVARFDTFKEAFRRVTRENNKFGAVRFGVRQERGN